MVKKSYNPFKMWGSYVGALVVLILGTIWTYSPLFAWNYDIGNISVKFLISISLIVGFLIGWGIHSLVRSLRK